MSGSDTNALVQRLNGSCPAHIAEDMYGVRIIEFKTPSGFKVRFNADWIPAANLEWFAEVLSAALVEHDGFVRERVRMEIQSKLDDFASALGKRPH